MLPDESLTVIALPGVPVPLIEPPSDGLTVGADGAGAIVLGTVLPDGSLVITGPVNGVPGVLGVQTTIPVDVAGLGEQVAFGNVTVSPGVVPEQMTVPLPLA